MKPECIFVASLLFDKYNKDKMSYFIATYKADLNSSADLKNSFVYVVPETNRKDPLIFEGGQTFLSIYGHNKVIKDIFHQSTKTGSWIAIIGTPLLEFKNEEEKDNFLTRFFQDPKAMIRDRIDGCWCILAYDAVADNFYACSDYDNTIPIYYASNETGIYFSSHELPLARFLGGQIDPLGFSMTIQLKLTWGSHTRFENIKKLLPAQIMIFKGLEKTLMDQYWRASEEKQWPANFDNVMWDWIYLLKKSVSSFYKSSANKTVMCDITGGEDSRLILSTVHSLDIPFIAAVEGNENDLDVIIAKRLSNKGGFRLIIRPKPLLSEELLLARAVDISLFNDAYEDYFASCAAYVRDSATPSINYDYVKYCGAPGGEVFRGSYYLRGKAMFPSSSRQFDYKFFTKMKYLLDFLPGLLLFPDEEVKQVIFNMIEEAVLEVSDFPIGIRIDHLLRVFQTCNTGLIYKIPRYLPFASKDLTKSVYKIPPKYKKGGKLTKACTEILYPEIAFVKTQKGVSTVRKSILRYHQFFPEHISTIKSITSGTLSRLLKWRDSNKPNLNWERNAWAIRALLTKPPYSRWFSSCDSMITGRLYNAKSLETILSDAREKTTRSVPTLGRIISQELAFRWVYKEL